MIGWQGLIMTEHNHITKLMKMIRAGELPIEPGIAHAVDVLHDDDCGIFDGGRCNCDPDIRLRWMQVAASRN